MGVGCAVGVGCGGGRCSNVEGRRDHGLGVVMRHWGKLDGIYFIGLAYCDKPNCDMHPE